MADGSICWTSRARKRGALLLASVALACLANVPIAEADDVAKAKAKTDIAVSALEFGGSLGKLIWVSTDHAYSESGGNGGKYQELAKNMRKQIEIGRASSSLVAANFDVIGTGIAYVALADPEPTSKAVAAVAAWGAKKAGDYFAGVALDQAKDRAQNMLVTAIQESGLSDAELDSLKGDDIRKRVLEFRLGGKTIAEVMHDDPGSLRILQESAVDISLGVGLKALKVAEVANLSVEQMKSDLAGVRIQIEEYQKKIDARLDKVDARLTDLQSATQVASEKLNVLNEEVKNNTKAINALAEISFSGWTTSQKLQSVRGGLFPDLDEGQRKALVESLEADQARENLVGEIQGIANDLGDVASIASNLGLPPDVVDGVKGAQTVAVGLAKFATGDYLGAVASVTSLVGLGAPDAGAQRHAAMMKYLAEQFAQINVKLDKIIDLQVKTLEAISKLSQDQQKFRREVLTRLDQIEAAVLNNDQILQAILLNEWTDCNALIGGTPLKGQFAITSRQMLMDIISAPHINKYAGGCHAQLVSFLDAWVVSAKWSGQLIAAENFPTDKIAENKDVLINWHAYQSQRSAAYRTARDFVKLRLKDAAANPAGPLARFLQPVVNARYQAELMSAMAKTDVRAGFASFTCGQTNVLSPGVRDLVCHGLGGDDHQPLQAAWSNLLDAALIGPHSFGLIDTGIVLSTLSDLAWRNNDGSFTFVPVTDIDRFPEAGPSESMRNALGQDDGKGVALLRKLQWLADAHVLQQSIAYGDHTAQLIEELLYDPNSRSLRTNLDQNDKERSELTASALTAMRESPVLARNVVLLGMRHAVSDAVGGPEKADDGRYSQLFYHLALSDFQLPGACTGDPLVREKLGQLFPNWTFEFRVTQAQRSDPALEKCPVEQAQTMELDKPSLPSLGNGAAVRIADFYVLVPPPTALVSGRFEVPDSLRLALLYRDKVSQAIADRAVLEVTKAVAGSEDGTKEMAFELVNEGWDWAHRSKQKN